MEYREFFTDMLYKYTRKKPAKITDLTSEQKSKFFKEIKQKWNKVKKTKQTKQKNKHLRESILEKFKI